MPPRIHRKSVIAIIIIGFFTVMTWLPVRPALSDAPSAIDPGDAWQTITVKKTFDNASFDYQIKLHAQRNGYRVYQIKYPSPIKTPLEQNNTVPAEYYLPDGILPGDCPNFRAAKIGLSPYSQAARRDLPANSRRQRRIDRPGLLGSRSSGCSSDYVSAAILWRTRPARRSDGSGKRPKTLRRRDCTSR